MTLITRTGHINLKLVNHCIINVWDSNGTHVKIDSDTIQSAIRCLDQEF